MTANAFEAFIGAIHCAEGIEKAREVILGIFIEELKTFDPEGNYKGRLKEHVERHSLGVLKYSPSDEGPPATRRDGEQQSVSTGKRLRKVSVSA